ncbi:TPA: acyltransferase [Streptococcus suis]|nr:acyltransferase [Streptococcus suis]
MYKKSSNRIIYLDVARSIAVILIALNHAVNRAYDNYHNQLLEFNTIPIVSTIFKAIMTVGSHLGVPLFLMITGALIFRKRFDNENSVRRFYKHNWLRLLITSEIWMFMMYWVQILGNYPHLLALEHIPTLILNLIKTMLFIDPIVFDSLWYIPMILAVYLMLPILVNAVHQFSLRVLVIPTLIVIVSGMLVPFVNDIFYLFGSDYQILFSIAYDDIFSVYLPYVIAGYWISMGGLKKISNLTLRVSAALLFAAIAGFQLFAYSTNINYILDYDFIGFLVVGSLLFEIISREASHVKSFSAIFEYISLRAFAIYTIQKTKTNL